MYLGTNGLTLPTPQTRSRWEGEEGEEEEGEDSPHRAGRKSAASMDDSKHGPPRLKHPAGSGGLC